MKTPKVQQLVDTPKGVTTLSGADAYEHLKDSMGRFRTLSLFWEHRLDKYPAPFTLKDKEHKGRMSMYAKYMEIGDPTEYTQAIALLGSWRHWEMLVAAEWFKPFITRWRDELKVKFESDRYREMVKVAEEQAGTPQGAQATKWLAERYSKVSKSKRGRPSKVEKKNALREELREEKLLQQEAERLSLGS